MIRWDPAGEHIIVERPEQLALHVLPSVYRQSRFTSSLQQLDVRFPVPARCASLTSSLQIYGFICKVNPVIDDPDASKQSLPAGPPQELGGEHPRRRGVWQRCR